MQSEAEVIEENAKLTQMVEKLSELRQKKLIGISKAEKQLAILKQQHTELEAQLRESARPASPKREAAGRQGQETRNHSINAIEYDLSYINPQVSQNDNIVYDYSKITHKDYRQLDISENNIATESKDEYYDYNGYLRKFQKKKELLRHKDRTQKGQTKKSDEESRTVISDIKNHALYRKRNR